MKVPCHAAVPLKHSWGGGRCGPAAPGALRPAGAPRAPRAARSRRKDAPLSAEGPGRGGERRPEQVPLGSAPGRLSDLIGAAPARTPEVWVLDAAVSATRWR